MYDGIVTDSGGNRTIYVVFCKYLGIQLSRCNKWLCSGFFQCLFLSFSSLFEAILSYHVLQGPAGWYYLGHQTEHVRNRARKVDGAKSNVKAR
jgi:hypothetical protein